MEKLIKVSKEVENSNKLLFKSYNHVEAEKELSREQEIISVAKNLIKLNLPIETIAKCVKISIKKVQKILGLF